MRRAKAPSNSRPGQKDLFGYTSSVALGISWAGGTLLKMSPSSSGKWRGGMTVAVSGDHLPTSTVQLLSPDYTPVKQDAAHESPPRTPVPAATPHRGRAAWPASWPAPPPTPATTPASWPSASASPRFLGHISHWARSTDRSHQCFAVLQAGPTSGWPRRRPPARQTTSPLDWPGRRRTAPRTAHRTPQLAVTSPRVAAPGAGPRMPGRSRAGSPTRLNMADRRPSSGGPPDEAASRPILPLADDLAIRPRVARKP